MLKYSLCHVITVNLFYYPGAPVVPVVITLIVDLAGGNDPSDDIVIRRDEEDISLYVSYNTNLVCIKAKYYYSYSTVYFLFFYSCFLSDVGAFWGAFMVPLLIIMLFNVVLFIFISVVLVRHVRKRTKKSESANHKVVFRTTLSIFGLMTLFGLTWLFAIFTFSAAPELRQTFQILFTVFNSFQGAFIFIFTCVLSSDAREGWKTLLTIKKSDTVKLSQYSTYKSGSSTTGTTTLQSGFTWTGTLLRVRK